MADRPTRYRVSAVVFQEEGWWCAQCLEYDIVAQTKDITDLHTELEQSLMSQIVISLELGREPFAGIGPAPQKYWDMFEAAKSTLERERSPLRVPPTLGDFDIIPKLRFAEHHASQHAMA